MATREFAAHEAHAHVAPQGFIRKWVFSLDHKVIGLQYYFLALTAVLVGMTLSLLMRIHLIWPNVHLSLLGDIKPETYLTLVTMHGTIMVFFVLTTAPQGGFGNYFLPIQIGAADMAFPVLNMLSFWVTFLAFVVMLGAFFVTGGAPLHGWTGYPPLSAVPTAGPGEGPGADMWIISIALFCIGALMSALNFITTTLDMRAKGMSMMRMPLTCWAWFITAILGLLAFGVLFSAGILLLLDRNAGTSFYVPLTVFSGQIVAHKGGSPLLWQHLFWFLGHPEVYVLILPALGIACDIIPAFTRKPVFGYRSSVWCLVAVGLLSMIVWGHHMFVSGMSPFSGEYFSLATLTITVPMTIFGVNMLASLWGAKLELRSPMLFVCGVIALFGSGGLGGLFLGNATADMQLHDTYFVVGHFHMMIGGVTLLATFAAIYFWFPKMFGKSMSETLGKAHFWLTFAPFFTIFFMQHFLGLQGAPRRYYAFTAYDYLQKTRGQNLVISLAAFLLIAGQFVFIVNFVWSLVKGRVAAMNPWRATTLEWTVPSPPPHGNFETIPAVARWPYEYGVPGPDGDFASQTVPASRVAVTA